MEGFLYSCYARLISFEVNANNKKLLGYNTNIWINALATALVLLLDNCNL